jgi:voltage-gated potassium channel
LRPRPVYFVVQRFLDRATLRAAILLIVTLSTLFVLAAALLERIIEPHTFHSFGEACWWSVQTVSTVGYGDVTPTSSGGRFVASAVMIFGMAFVPAVTSIVVAILVERNRPHERRRDEPA